jgi:predicted negative regulator of RcsB-dependent stress response
MREDLEQQEQLDAIKGFWADNRKWILPLIILLAMGAAGFNGWNWWQHRQSQAATDALAAMESAPPEQNIDKAKAAYKALADGHGASAQAAIAGLQMARALAGSGDLPQAREALQKVIATSGDEFAWVARIRAAGIMLDEGNAKGALDMVSGKAPKEYEPLVLDRKGDAQAALGMKEEARTSWKAAADGLGPQSASRELVLRKLQTIDSFDRVTP